MRYENVCVESFGYTLPEDIVTSAELEQQLAPLYERLRLPEGRLELMTGIEQRRFFPPHTMPGDKSIESGEKAIAAAGIDRQDIGVLIHGSVCRDYLEPATASRVHHELGLSPRCVVHDVSNACLGLLNGMLAVANMIELGQVRAGLVVGTEIARPLVETTIAALNDSEHLTRRQIKPAIASLTIGSGSCAVLLTDRQTSRTDNRLAGAAVRAHTQHNTLCQSCTDEAVGHGMQPLMDTDSEQLMREGIETGAQTFPELLAATGWDRASIDHSVCHQVGMTHRRLMLQALDLPEQRDYATVTWLGNTGSVALPVTLATALERGVVQSGENIALLGIGSGINSVMLGVQWQRSLVMSNRLPTQSWAADEEAEADAVATRV